MVETLGWHYLFRVTCQSKVVTDQADYTIAQQVQPGEIWAQSWKGDLEVGLAHSGGQPRRGQSSATISRATSYDGTSGLTSNACKNRSAES